MDRILPTFNNLFHFNPLVTNGLSLTYHLYKSTFNFRNIRSSFSFLFQFSMKIMSANRIALDWTPRFAASHLRLFCLPMFHKKDARLIWVKSLNPRFKPKSMAFHATFDFISDIYTTEIDDRKC